MSISDEFSSPDNDRSLQPHSSNRYVLFFGFIMLVGIMVLAWIGRPRPSIAIGEPLPPLDLLPLVGVEQPVTNQELAGKLVVLHFWGTWCPPCLKEFPEFAELVSEFGSHAQIAFVSVSCSGGPEYDIEGLRRDTQSFLAKNPVEVATYCDPAAMTRQQLALLLPNGSFGYPTTLLVGRDGKIIEAMEGYYPGEMKKLSGTIRNNLGDSN